MLCVGSELATANELVDCSRTWPKDPKAYAERALSAHFLLRGFVEGAQTAPLFGDSLRLRDRVTALHLLEFASWYWYVLVRHDKRPCSERGSVSNACGWLTTSLLFMSLQQLSVSIFIALFATDFESSRVLPEPLEA